VVFDRDFRYGTLVLLTEGRPPYRPINPTSNAQLQKGFESDALGAAVSVPNAGPARTSMSGVAAIDHPFKTNFSARVNVVKVSFVFMMVRRRG
jgi:hypothetical protein